MGFEVVDSSNKCQAFIIHSTDPNPKRTPYKFYCMTTTPDDSFSWRIEFEMVLQRQKDFILALQFPMKYQDQLQKPKTKEEITLETKK